MATLTSTPVNLDFEQGVQADGLPLGWGGGGSGYTLAVDHGQYHSGSASGAVKGPASASSGQFGTLTQCITPTAYAGHNLRYAGWLRTASVGGWVGLWIRVDGPNHQILAFDNMAGRHITGTTGWTDYSTIQAVSSSAVRICFGFLLSGTGTLWGDDLSMATTTQPVSLGTNLDFEGGAASNGYPNGWSGGGTGYALSVDTATFHGGRASGRISGPAVAAPNTFGTLTQCFGVPSYLQGHSLRYTGFLKTSSVSGGWAGLWLRVDGPNNQTTAFDNMQNRGITGTTGWTQYSITLPVASNAAQVCFGFLLTGSGTAWGDDLSLTQQ